MRSFTYAVLLSTVFSLVAVSRSQQPQTSPVPNLITYSGDLVISSGLDAPAKVVGITFAIYRQQDGGAPIQRNCPLCYGCRHSGQSWQALVRPLLLVA
jgi:hypothetical protein